MAKGSVKWFNTSKGYGFISFDERASDEVFVHYSSIQGEGFTGLTEGQRVEFDLVEEACGLRAANVEIALD